MSEQFRNLKINKIHDNPTNSTAFKSRNVRAFPSPGIRYDTYKERYWWFFCSCYRKYSVAVIRNESVAPYVMCSGCGAFVKGGL